MNVYVLGISIYNDTVWGVYTTWQAAELAMHTLDKREGGRSWIMEVPLRDDGSLPAKAFIA